MIELNCDMGESFGIYKAGNDEEIMPLIAVSYTHLRAHETS